MSIIFALVIFEIIIVIHELGHFIVAKKCGVKVNEFAIGMGPAIIKKQKGETLYSWRLFPIGGYCSMEGEDSESSDGRAFCNKSVPKRMAIVVAGIVMNLILGIVLLIIHTSLTAPMSSTQISWFEDNAKSQESGLQVGDEIVKVNGMRIFTAMDLSYQFQNDEDSIFDMTVVRNGEKVDLENVAFNTDNKTMHIDFKVAPVEATVGTVLTYSFKQTLGLVKTCGSFTDMKKPEHVVKAFIRFALAQGAVMSGMELLTAIFSVVQGIVTNIMSHSGMAGGTVTELPSEIVDKIEAVGMLESIPLWIVTLLGSLLITVLSFVMILTVYGRMFKLYMYTAIAPIPLATFAGEPTQSVGKNFIRSYAGVCLEGAIIALACIIFSVFASSPPAIGDTSLSAVTIVWNYVGELVFNLLVLVGAVKASDRIVKEIMGL